MAPFGRHCREVKIFPTQSVSAHADQRQKRKKQADEGKGAEGGAGTVVAQSLLTDA